MSILNSLNEMQKSAAERLEGQTLILAGAGSGKTRTLTYKIAHMIKERNISPSNILALTFTNKAAEEMKQRIEKLTNLDSKLMTVSTFHSFAVKLLRKYAHIIGYSRNFNIYDNSDQKTILKKIIKDLKLEKMFKESEVLSRISRLKELGINYTNLSKVMNLNIPSNSIFKDIFMKYQEKLEKNNSMDFSDLLVNARDLLKDKLVCDEIQEKYKYILIDEYQDTNEIQYQIVTKIASKYKNICVVGDEDQSIYSFRGANIENILNFENDYPDAKVIKLEQNYRSTQNILNVANSVIKNNKTSMGKRLWSAKEKGDKIKLFNASNANNEADFVATKIFELKNKGINLKDICILYRVNAQSRAFEESLRNNNLSYKILGSLQFFDRKEIKDIISYLLLINNFKDDLSFERVINTPKRSIGDKSIENLAKISNINEISLFEAVDYLDNSFSDNLKKKIRSFKEMIQKYKKYSEQYTLSELVQEIIEEINYFEYLKTFENGEERIENVKELINSIMYREQEIGYLSLEEYLESISLNTNNNEEKEDLDSVKLMTIHSAKGLEFKVVFLTGVEEGLFPKESANIDENEIEEERRLFYVAVTRAEKKLYITHANERILWGNYNSFGIKKSRFIDEMDLSLVEEIYNPLVVNRLKKIVEEPIKSPFYNHTMSIPKEEVDTIFKVGKRVEHISYGVGIVKSVNSKTIIINFSGEEKKLALKLADKFLKLK